MGLKPAEKRWDSHLLEEGWASQTGWGNSPACRVIPHFLFSAWPFYSHGFNHLHCTRPSHIVSLTLTPTMSLIYSDCPPGAANMSDFTPSGSESHSSDQMEQRRVLGHRNGESVRDLSPQELFNQISRAVAGATKHQHLAYEGIDPETGSLVVDSLDQDERVEGVTHR